VLDGPITGASQPLFAGAAATAFGRLDRAVIKSVLTTSRRWPADTRRSPALLGFDVHSHAFILAPWRACVSLASSVRFFNTL
jgi:hypothetical protein